MVPAGQAPRTQQVTFTKDVAPIVLDVQRFYDECGGTLTPDVNTAGIPRATEEDNAARKATVAGGRVR